MTIDMNFLEHLGDLFEKSSAPSTVSEATTRAREVREKGRAAVLKAEENRGSDEEKAEAEIKKVEIPPALFADNFRVAMMIEPLDKEDKRKYLQAHRKAMESSGVRPDHLIASIRQTAKIVADIRHIHNPLERTLKRYKNEQLDDAIWNLRDAYDATTINTIIGAAYSSMLIGTGRMAYPLSRLGIPGMSQLHGLASMGANKAVNAAFDAVEGETAEGKPLTFRDMLEQEFKNGEIGDTTVQALMTAFSADPNKTVDMADRLSVYAGDKGEARREGLNRLYSNFVSSLSPDGLLDGDAPGSGIKRDFLSRTLAANTRGGKFVPQVRGAGLLDMFSVRDAHGIIRTNYGLEKTLDRLGESEKYYAGRRTQVMKNLADPGYIDSQIMNDPEFKSEYERYMKRQALSDQILNPNIYIGAAAGKYMLTAYKAYKGTLPVAKLGLFRKLLYLARGKTLPKTLYRPALSLGKALLDPTGSLAGLWSAGQKGLLTSKAILGTTLGPVVAAALTAAGGLYVGNELGKAIGTDKLGEGRKREIIDPHTGGKSYEYLPMNKQNPLVRLFGDWDGDRSALASPEEIERIKKKYNIKPIDTPGADKSTGGLNYGPLAKLRS